jgi:hypothetical protein
MYKIGYSAYGIKVVNIIWDETVLNVNNKWRVRFARYYVKLSKYKHIALDEYGLCSLLNERRYSCIRIIKFVKELKIKLMLD